MIQRLSHTTLYVLDQDAAKEFYVNKLGFEVRMDVKMDNGFRWLTVSPKGNRSANHPDMQPEAAKTIRTLLAEGKINGGVLQTSDCRATYEELKSKGVEFLCPPKEQFYGVEAILKDNSGNWFSMTEPKGA
jgi:catechol 2,3-dioxygenase-like lactoylglutathione lyase family enzyme